MHDIVAGHYQCSVLWGGDANGRNGPRREVLAVEGGTKRDGRVVSFPTGSVQRKDCSVVMQLHITIAESGAL